MLTTWFKKLLLIYLYKYFSLQLWLFSHVLLFRMCLLKFVLFELLWFINGFVRTGRSIDDIIQPSDLLKAMNCVIVLIGVGGPNRINFQRMASSEGDAFLSWSYRDLNNIIGDITNRLKFCLEIRFCLIFQLLVF